MLDLLRKHDLQGNHRVQVRPEPVSTSSVTSVLGCPMLIFTEYHKLSRFIRRMILEGSVGLFSVSTSSVTSVLGCPMLIFTEYHKLSRFIRRMILEGYAVEIDAREFALALESSANLWIL
ncbi:hypothetical protein Acr_12g0002840 [Actinidia rufa]|uniref:Uncharacterized protein n=1 Tax=Actinidia rufa TaxID=165716 RepID=A0A7J0FGM8_9ERIC|nr:hypothetical protein Acr_12g0002840 [Actinidia rufa]